jgi:hypothetical protein
MKTLPINNKMTFSTFDVRRILGVKRHRLQQWIEKEFVIPSVERAKRVGSKSIFSLKDLYKLKLFLQLADLGIPLDGARLTSIDENFKYDFLYIKKDNLGRWTTTHGKTKAKYKLDAIFQIVINLKVLKDTVNESITDKMK